METNANPQNTPQNITTSVVYGIAIGIGAFVFFTILFFILGGILLGVSGVVTDGSALMPIVYCSPSIGVVCAIVAGIRDGRNKYKELRKNDVRNSIKNSIRNNIRIEPLELQSIASERKSNPAEFQEEEMQKWKTGFIKIGWMEEIGKNTETALKESSEEHRTAQEPLLCVAYADVKENRITGVRFNQVDLYSPFTAFIATSNRIILIHPAKKIVKVIEYKNIHEVEKNSHAHSKTYTISTISGDTVEIDVNFSSKDNETIVDAFFKRTTSAK